MSTESNFSFTTKVNGDLFTVRGDTVEEFKANLRDAVTLEALDYAKALQEHAHGQQQPTTAQAVANVQAAFPGAQVVEERPAPQPVQQFPSVAPTAQGGPDPKMVCKHGARVQRTGVSARGPWTAYFCPTPKGTPDQCKPNFV